MSTSIYDCPQCGAPIKFQSSIAIFMVCEHCRSMVLRKDLKLETLGIMAELPPDLSPLQMGTRGEWNGRAFELVGRVRVEWLQGSWNEWYAIFGGSEGGWIAESQGFYMVSFETKDKNVPKTLDQGRANGSLELAGKTWSISDMKSVRCCAGEGELPFAAPPGAERMSVDLTAADGSFGSLEFTTGETQLYVGAYANFDDLHFANLRPVPGWSTDAPQIRNETSALNCPKCGAVVNVRALGQTMTAVCGSCGSIIDTANPVWTLVQEQDEKVAAIRPGIEIGKRGTLEGIEYEVIGFVNRADSDSTWSEYLLFNPWHGFEWLVTYRDHWTFVHRCPEIGRLSGARVTHAGHTFSRYAEGEAIIQNVLGEFYWKVRRGERAITVDYIDPPLVLTKETYPELQEFTWSLGKYLEPSVIAAAFGLKNLPKPDGLYLNQPNPYAVRWEGVRWMTKLFFIIFTMIQIIAWARTSRKAVYEMDLLYNRDAASKIVASPKFQLTGGPQIVQIEAHAMVDNTWINLDVELIDATTNQVYADSIEIEYYQGYDEGEHWSEGSRTNSVNFQAVSPGEYYLNIEPSADPWLLKMPYHLTVKAGGIFWSNYILGLFLLLSYPCYLLLRRGGFENKRWGESDYTPLELSSTKMVNR